MLVSGAASDELTEPQTFQVIQNFASVTLTWAKQKGKMDAYPLTVREIVSWFLSKKTALALLGIIVAGVHERHGTDKPAAFADFDTDFGIGRIMVWVSGEIDLHVLRVSDGKDVLIRHEKVSTLNAPSLQDAFNEFVRSMTHPDNDVVPL